MLMKKPKYRIFDYTPRFYKPESDVKERKKRKLGFSFQRRKLQSKRTPILWILLTMIAVYIYLMLRGAI